MRFPRTHPQAGPITALINEERFKDAYELSLRMAKEGSTSAQLILAWLYQFGKGVPRDLDKARYWYTSAVESNSPSAEFYLGLFYWNESDFNQAIPWLEKAASHGYTTAAYHLARMYRHGIGAPRDIKLELKYVQQAAQGGHLFAKRDLAREMLQAKHGLSRIPLGFFRLMHVAWLILRTAMRNPEDDSLLRL